MVEILINPTKFKDIYIECLNKCFENWGGFDNYNWTFTRECGSDKADIIVLKKNGDILAGSAITYRMANINNELVKVGIMTASWTLPEARGQGCFAGIVEESLKLTSDNNTALLLSFGTGTNASFRGLKRAGAEFVPLYYMESECKEEIQNCNKVLVTLSKKDIAIKEIYNSFIERQKGFSHFVYSYEQWYSQYISRPSNIIVLSISSTGYAIMQEFSDFFRIIFLIVEDRKDYKTTLSSLMNMSHSLGKKLQYFTMDTSVKSICDKLGFNTILSFMGALTSKAKIDEISLDSIEYSKFQIVPWYLQSGDRM
jgi:hypothetical protein